MEPDWPAQRARMARDQLFSRGILDPRVLEAMGETPRHLFVPESQRARSYEDRALPIGYGQTISQPYMVGLMLKTLELTGKEKVLEIGTGSGYQAALLGKLARDVRTMEIVPELADGAERLLKSLGQANVQVYRRDGSGGLPEEAPFDAIILAAAAPDVPPPLLHQLADGGKLLLPVGRGGRHHLTLIQKRGTAVERKDLGECVFVPLQGQYGKIPRLDETRGF